MADYVHGYSDREMQRLRDQSCGLEELLHTGTTYATGAHVLEAGCGVGAQTVILGRRSPDARLTCVDISTASLAQAKQRAQDAHLDNVSFQQADLMRLPFRDDAFDHVFVCFVLEHLPDPLGALRELKRVLRPGGTITAIEGDHGSCYFHPERPEAVRAWRCLIDAQAKLKGDSLIGRRLYPLLRGAGFDQVHVRPRMVYADDSCPEMVEAFVRKIIIPMVEGVQSKALEWGWMTGQDWDEGIRSLHETASRDGTFCYTFFKGLGTK